MNYSGIRPIALAMLQGKGKAHKTFGFFLFTEALCSVFVKLLLTEQNSQRE